MKQVFLRLLVLFVAAQLMALAVGSGFIARHISVLENPEDPGNAITLIAYVLVAAAVLLLVLKFYSGDLLFKAMEFGLIFFSAFMAFRLAIDSPYALVISLLAAASRFLYPPIRIYLLLLSAAVAGAILGASLGPTPAIAFAALLSAYDVLAVFYTKHMIALARGLNSRGTSFSIQISASSHKAKTSSAYKPKRGGKAADKKTSRKKPFESIELGTGDLVIPAMVIVSAAKLSLLQAGAALLGAVAGLLLLFWLMTRRRGYWPALPPIVLGALAFLAAATLLA